VRICPTSLALLPCAVLLFCAQVLLDLPLNTITLVSLLLALALAIDYSCHIGHAYMTAPGPTRSLKVQHALDAIGFSIFNAGGSTLLGTLFLAASQSPVFRTFFVLVWGAIFLGLVAGLIVMPAALSFVGPLDTVHHHPPTPGGKGKDSHDDAGQSDAAMHGSAVSRTHSFHPASRADAGDPSKGEANGKAAAVSGGSTKESAESKRSRVRMPRAFRSIIPQRVRNTAGGRDVPSAADGDAPHRHHAAMAMT